MMNFEKFLDESLIKINKIKNAIKKFCESFFVMISICIFIENFPFILFSKNLNYIFFISTQSKNHQKM